MCPAWHLQWTEKLLSEQPVHIQHQSENNSSSRTSIKNRSRRNLTVAVGAKRSEAKTGAECSYQGVPHKQNGILVHSYS